jgi:D-alanyl-D-alanine carboxypeptidase/D-alanyl-D-alanine-endopeptidase (penicillin-binding protein 4)
MNNVSKNKDVFYYSLPVSGESGTLDHFLKNTFLEGKVHAKSGTLSRVKSYAGYIDKDGKKYVFAIIVNNPNGNSYAVTKRMEKFLLSID